MKYKVIGWTYYDDSSVRNSDKPIGFAERNAIIDEIRKHKYLFSGWHHQESWENCTPILNDGLQRTFSQRGWGGVMAEAYGNMDDYGYSIYTFHGSIDSSYLKFPEEQFDANDFVPEPLENEHFNVEVSRELFDIAKKKNPFYLEYIDDLRYIDTNDTITVSCSGESLTFLVSAIDRNKKEIKFKNPELIKGTYKIIVNHKPITGKIMKRTPIMVDYSEVSNVFVDSINDYNFSVLFELINNYDMDTLVENTNKKSVVNGLIRFVNEYLEYTIDEKIILKVLRYIDNFKLFKEVALKYMDIYPKIYHDFLSFYINKNKNVDEYINGFIKIYKKLDCWSDKIMLKAITLNSGNKSLRKSYYADNKFMNTSGLVIMAGGKLFDSLCKEDKKLVYLNKEKITSNDILSIAELMYYDNKESISQDVFPYNLPYYYKLDQKCIADGVHEYINYMNDKYDLSNNMEKLFLFGISKRCANMEGEYNAFASNAAYIFALDILSSFKYNLKEKAINNYGEKYPEFIEEINEIYNNK